ncbi:trehalose-phosphatase [Silvibacterium sp.]|uniref:trehalose-phosphatase n=1 Tax=Silvibacterium sp. TaxID=1964179 RepID=UPI0039E25D7A
MTAPLVDHLPLLREAVTSASHIVLLLDFDGTLAPLVQRPEIAELPEATRAALTALHASPRVTLAFISGRALDDLRSRVGLDAIYAGNHGLEIEGPGLAFDGVDLTRAGEAIRTISVQLSEKLQAVPGAQVEDKQSSLSVHYRNVDPALVSRVLHITQSVTGVFLDLVALHEGKMVIEVRPRVDWNKGKASEWILSRFPAPSPLSIAMGDDRTDEDIFLTPPVTISIKVGEGPTAAGFRAKDPAEVCTVLEMIRGIVTPSPAS